MTDNAAEILFKYSVGCCEQFWHGLGWPLFVVVHQAFPLLTSVSPTHQGAMRDGFREAVMACDMPEPWEFPSLASCQKRFLWAHKEVGLAPPHPLVGLVLHVGNAELASFSESGSRVHVSQP